MEGRAEKGRGENGRGRACAFQEALRGKLWECKRDDCRVEWRRTRGGGSGGRRRRRWSGRHRTYERYDAVKRRLGVVFNAVGSSEHDVGRDEASAAAVVAVRAPYAEAHREGVQCGGFARLRGRRGAQARNVGWHVECSPERNVIAGWVVAAKGWSEGRRTITPPTMRVSGCTPADRRGSRQVAPQSMHARKNKLMQMDQNKSEEACQVESRARRRTRAPSPLARGYQHDKAANVSKHDHTPQQPPLLYLSGNGGRTYIAALNQLSRVALWEPAQPKTATPAPWPEPKAETLSGAGLYMVELAIFSTWALVRACNARGQCLFSSAARQQQRQQHQRGQVGAHRSSRCSVPGWQADTPIPSPFQSPLFAMRSGRQQL